MEILLLQDIQGIGKKNDLLIVGDGYALNFLLPQSKALIATPTVRRRFAEHIRRRAIEAENERKSAAKTAAAASGKTVAFTKKVTKTGKLYAAITQKHIAKALKEQHGITVKESHIKIDEQIKSTGDFTVAVKVGDNQEKLTVTVKAEK